MAFIIRTLSKLCVTPHLRQTQLHKSTCVQLNRSLVKVSGDETVNFLQGLVSNDVRHLTENGGTSVTLPCIYTLILNLEGRVLYDAILYNAPGSNAKEIWVECDTTVTEDVIKMLKKYRVRRKIDISLIEDLSVWANLDCHSEDCNAKRDAVLFAKDPRLQSLGFRAIVPKANSSLVSDNIQLYTRMRYQLGVGEGVEDHPSGNCFPLEVNGDYLHGVSFFKGCYIGQELTSRVHHTGFVRKRYMPVILNQPISNIPAGTVIQNEKGRSVGKFRNSIDDTGIALLRIEEVLCAKELRIKDYGPVTTFVPDWWPKKAPIK